MQAVVDRQPPAVGAHEDAGGAAGALVDADADA